MIIFELNYIDWYDHTKIYINIASDRAWIQNSKISIVSAVPSPIAVEQIGGYNSWMGENIIMGVKIYFNAFI